MTGTQQVLMCAGAPGQTVMQILQANSATSGLVLCLDAGDISSYLGSGQTWLDVSGNGNHYYLGSGSSSDAADPTFVGTAGTPTAYFELPDGTYFSATATQTFADNFHKNNATFSILAVFYPRAFATSTAGAPFFANRTNTAAAAGIILTGFANTSGSMNMRHSITTTTSTNESVLTANTPALQEWNFYLGSADEATTTMVQRINGIAQSSGTGFSASTDTDTVTSSTPKLFAESTGISETTNTSRIAAICIWNRAIGTTEAATLYSAFKARWTTFPLEAMFRDDVSGTVTVPTGATSCVIECWGGGGGGGADNTAASGGGSGGGYCKLTRPVLSGEWGTNLSYTRGSRGNRGTGNANGANGTATTASGTLNGSAFSLNAPGGNGGTGGGNGGAASSTPTGGDVNTASAAGGNPSGVSGGAGSTAGPLSIPAPGGAGVLDNGTASFNFGGGGGGGGEDGDGGNGADGSVMFTFY